MEEKNHQWDDFQALVTWATWEIVKGITSGEELRSVVFRVLATARGAEFKQGK